MVYRRGAEGNLTFMITFTFTNGSWRVSGKRKEA